MPAENSLLCFQFSGVLPEGSHRAVYGQLFLGTHAQSLLGLHRFFERARILGCDHIATGHYARIEENGEGYVLKKALDPQKDQSYVLYTLTQEQLAHTIFPWAI